MPRRGKPEPKRITRERFDDFLEHRLAMDITARESLRALTASLVDDMCCSRAWSRSHLLLTLLQLREATLRLLQTFAAWRRTLVRPEPYVYGGQNFIVKMGSDANFLQFCPAHQHFGFTFGGSNLFALPIAVSSRRTAGFDTRPDDDEEAELLAQLATVSEAGPRAATVGDDAEAPFFLLRSWNRTARRWSA